MESKDSQTNDIVMVDESVEVVKKKLGRPKLNKPPPEPKEKQKPGPKPKHTPEEKEQIKEQKK